MANTKISALPIFTGDTTGVYLVIDNAGLTQTYKISIDSLLSALSGITTTNDIQSRKQAEVVAFWDDACMQTVLAHSQLRFVLRHT